MVGGSVAEVTLWAFLLLGNPGVFPERLVYKVWNVFVVGWYVEVIHLLSTRNNKELM